MDWICYQIVMWLPCHRLNPRSKVYGGIILPRAGRYANE